MKENQDAKSNINRIVIAVHGIGDQVRNATAQQVAKMFGAGVIPLGAFPEEIEKKVDGEAEKIEPAWVSDSDRWKIGDEDWRRSWMKAGTAFAEVYWADIPRAMAAAGYTVQETKSWGLTVVDRLRARDTRKCPGRKRRKRSAAVNTNGQTGGTVSSSAASDSEPRESYRKLNEDNNLRVDYDKAAAVLEEFVDGIQLVETIGKVGGRVGLPEFNAAKVLNDYVNDVQVVAEFREQRERIVSRFIRTLRKVHAAHPDAEIHIVAHSEGTVVALLGLLHAFCDTKFYRASCYHLDEDTEEKVQDIQPGKGRQWLAKVRGLITIGSPIDKHIVMWPELWEGEDWKEPADKLGRFSIEKPIPWFNYYDKGDPVGFDLNTARDFLGAPERGLVNRNLDGTGQKPLLSFPEEHDLGFTRYPLPGKAHNDYFTDTDVFEHYSRQVTGEGSAGKPKTRRWAWVFSRVCPYLLAVLVMAVGVWLLHKAVLEYLLPVKGTANAAADVATQAKANTPPNPDHTYPNVAGITLLLVGMTVVTRLARLTRGRNIPVTGWHALGVVIFAGGAVGFMSLVSDDLLKTMGRGIVGWWGKSASVAHWVIIAVAAVGAVVLPFVPEVKRRDRQVRCAIAAGVFVAWLLWLGGASEKLQPWGVVLGSTGVSIVGWVLAYSLPRWGMVPLIVSGGLLAALSIIGCLSGNGNAADKTLWPVALAAVAFLYLWWLASVLFDLSFVWHRYICGNEAMRQLRGVFKHCDKRCKGTAPSAAPATQRDEPRRSPQMSQTTT